MKREFLVMMKREFLVTGQRPAYGKEVNDLIEALDLGVIGAFVPFSYVMTATLKRDVTEDQLRRQPEAIKQALEQNGCRNVVITPLKTKTRCVSRSLANPLGSDRSEDTS